MPILSSNMMDELQDIYAPFYTHNRYVGETLGLNYYGYPSDTEQYSATAAYSTKTQRDIDLTYKNVGAGEVGILWLGGPPGSKTLFTDCLGLAIKHQRATKPPIPPGRIL